MSKVEYIGADLERWRVENGYEIREAMEVLGLQNAAWYRMTSTAPNEVIQDKSLVRLLHLFKKHPETLPKPIGDELREIYFSLGFTEERSSLSKFADALGRSTQTIRRVVFNQGRLSKTTERLLEAYLRLDGDTRHKQTVMEQIAEATKESRTNSTSTRKNK